MCAADDDPTYHSPPSELRAGVLLGPVACHSCGAWVEWAGVMWLALATDEAHDCQPFLDGALIGRLARSELVLAQPVPTLTWAEPPWTEPTWLTLLTKALTVAAVGLGIVFVIVVLAHRTGVL